MIGEPEEVSEEPGRPGAVDGPAAGGAPADDLIEGGAPADGPAAGGGRQEAPVRVARRRVWAGVLTGVVAASAVWAAVLRGSGWGQVAPPDLHGYRLVDDLCSSLHLEPLSDALNGGFEYNVPVVRRGPTVDHMTCALTARSASADGWETVYRVTVSVDLHKKTDPRTEFTDLYGPPAQPPPGLDDDSGPYLQYLYTHETRVRAYPGLGDLAYQTLSPYHQGMSVLRGGAVVTMTLDATNVWTLSGDPPTDRNGAPERPARVTTIALRPALIRTVRHVMTVLSP
ncbi:hypothetical protein [Actinacidiphila acidipaludis]|uniref:Uncharacterized protein n=1 Tax=Actinacidiphila acidipaludis TaxID=2873382 RepID=A0ABS7Q536_9ACTN|nr:hypothetical protein [Streptomyces acidipaludis]MBY8878276.1 hypothetical protein [Streptomyces acidipaludis]